MRKIVIESIPIEKALEENYIFIDVRTKEEFKEFHIPGALNIPLFTLEERKKISEIYYSKGEKQARIFALKVISPRLPELVEKILKIKKTHGKVALYCWRGGMRSFSLAVVSYLAGVYIPIVKGGYRAFRKFILERIERLSERKTFIVLYGPTGCGKTKILRTLKLKGFPVIDLEGLAGHRGSVFGGIGLKQPSQKMFDAMLWKEMEKYKNSDFLIVEGESRKIGKIHIPETFWKAMKKGRKIILTLPIEERVKVSLEDYKISQNEPKIYIKSLEKIKKHLPLEKYNLIRNLIERENYREAVKELMISYYDPLYRKSTPEAEAKIEAKDVEDAVKKLSLYLSKLNNPVLA